MPIEFVSQAADPAAGSGKKFQAPTRDPWLFWWTLVIIVLTGVAIFTWVFSIYVFSYPEKPFNYDLLTRIEKLDPIARFPRLNVPGGRERTSKQIYANFYDFDPALTEAKNGTLKRSYLWNYTEEDPTYLIGEFEVTESRLLTPDDVFTSGVVIRAKSTDYPNAFLECIFPTAPDEAPPTEHFRPGDILNLEKNRSYTALLHLSWLNQDDLLITAVSLVYGRHRIDDTRFINQAPPLKLNMRGTWPLFTSASTASDTSDSDPEEEPEDDLPTEP